MPPRRKLTEILTLARLQKTSINLIVEGRSDQYIIRSFCEGAQIPNIIYPVTLIELDCIDGGPGGEKGRVLRTSEYLSVNAIRRICCVIDRDDFAFNDFMRNSHCIVTNFASLDLYSLDVDEFAGYVARHFQVDLTQQQMESILRAAARATILQWKRVLIVPNTSMADLQNSIKANGPLAEVDLADWIQRSRSKGGAKPDWDRLAQEIASVDGLLQRDYRETISVHLLDDVLRAWLRSVFGVTTPGFWVESHLRGMASYERLRGYDFFHVLADHCSRELAAD